MELCINRTRSNCKNKATITLNNAQLEDVYQEIRDIYVRYPQPWVIGYSGGKDSTTVLQLIWKALEVLPAEERKKPVYVISSDTLVETPVIIEIIDSTISKLNEAAKKQNLPFAAEKVVPTLKDSYWVNLIGRGYPAPTSRFRWCTERLKIKPADRFIQQKVSQYGEVIMVLGVREAESATRMQLMNSYRVKGHQLRRHSSLPGAYVYAPIAKFTTDDVWSYLLSVDSPWGATNRDLSALYRSADAAECPLVIDDSTPSCGNSRFGCWVCTVATKDQTMESLIDSGEEWMQPLLEFRNWLYQTTLPELKREFRGIQGRDGRILFKADGTAAARTYKFSTSVKMLKMVMEAQKAIREHNGNQDNDLISEEELHEMRRIWRTERQDWDDSVPSLNSEIFGNSIAWDSDDNISFGAEEKELLSHICEEQALPFELIARLLDTERETLGFARRANIKKKIESVLAREWRSEADLLTKLNHQDNTQ